MSAEIANIVFEFAEAIKGESTSYLKDADVLPSLYHPIRLDKPELDTVRIGDMQSSVPRILANGEVRQFNAVLTIQFFARADDYSIEKLLEARERADAISLELAKAIINDGSMGDDTATICGSMVTVKTNDWGKIGDGPHADHAVSYLLLRINPKDLG